MGHRGGGGGEGRKGEGGRKEGGERKEGRSGAHGAQGRRGEEGRGKKEQFNKLSTRLRMVVGVSNMLKINGESHKRYVKKQNFRLRRQGLKNQAKKNINKGLAGQNRRR